MTIIVGIISEDTIVLVSDSQTTRDASKLTGVDKIREIKFQNRQILVAEAGNSSFTDRVLDSVAEMAKDKAIEKSESVAVVVRAAMRRFFDEIRSQLGDCSSEEVINFVDQRGGCKVMAAFWSDDNPFILTFDFSRAGIPDPPRRDYAALGCGAGLADYLLKELFVTNAKADFCAALGAFVVDKVVANTEGCGHPIKIKSVVRSFSPEIQANLEKGFSAFAPPFVIHDEVFVIPEDNIELITEELHRIDTETKTERNKKIQASLTSIGHAILHDLIHQQITRPNIPD